MKAFTDIEQSKKLAEILPITTIDFAWNISSDGSTRLLRMEDWEVFENAKLNVEIIPCWSLAALLSVLPLPVLRYDIEDGEGGWIVSCEKDDKGYLSYYRNNPVDTCYEMILKLNEQKLL